MRVRLPPPCRAGIRRGVNRTMAEAAPRIPPLQGAERQPHRDLQGHLSAARTDPAARTTRLSWDREPPALTLLARRFPGSIEGRSSWVAASITLAILSFSYGAPLIVVVGLKPIAASLGTDRSVVALAASLVWLGTGVGGILMGRIADRIGMRQVAIFGAAMTALGLAVSAIGQTWALIIGSAVLIGLLGNSAHFPPLVTYVSRWFDRRRGTAVALISSGTVYRWRRLADGLRARHGRLRLAGDNAGLCRRRRGCDRAIGAVLAPAAAAGPDEAAAMLLPGTRARLATQLGVQGLLCAPHVSVLHAHGDARRPSGSLVQRSWHPGGERGG